MMERRNYMLHIHPKNGRSMNEILGTLRLSTAKN